MAWYGNILDSLLRRGRKSVSTRDKEYEWSYALDGFRRYVSEGATFEKIKSLLKAGDAGDLASTLELFEELEEKDWRLADAANTRRIAMTGLPWEVLSAADQQRDDAERNLADDAAAYVRETLNNLPGFDVALKHLSTAIGSNLAVAEITWEEKNPAFLQPIPSNRLTMGTQSPDVHIITQEAWGGIPAEPGKFIVHSPNPKCGFLFKGALHRAVAVLYMVKLLAIRDWSQFAQVFGMPHRVAKYRSNATAEEKEQAKKALENMGSAAWALVSESVEFAMSESTQRGVQPFETLLNYCDKQQTIAFLGGHLTTDTANATGTHAAGAVQNEVRKDLRDDDIASEGRTLRDQLIVPMCLFAFQDHVIRLGNRFPFPFFGRVVPETTDRFREGEIIELATQRLGLLVERTYAHDVLGIPEPEYEADGVTPVNPVIKRFAPIDPLRGGGFGFGAGDEEGDEAAEDEEGTAEDAEIAEEDEGTKEEEATEDEA